MTTITPDHVDEVVVEDPRLAARRAEVADAQHAGRGRRRRRWIRAAVATLAGTAMIATLLLSPVFGVRQLRVIGAGDLDPDLVIEAAGLTRGQAVWSVRPSDVSARLERRAEIDDARVVVRWPDTVELRVRPRVAIARLLPEGGESLLVAAGGVVLRAGVDDSLAVMPISVPDLGPLGPGDRVEASLSAAIDIAGQLPVPIALRVVAASIDADGAITLMGTAGVAIRLGNTDDIDDKLVAVEAMLSGQVDTTRICSLDVRNPKAAVLRRSPDCDPPPPPPPAPTPEAAVPTPDGPAPGEMPVDGVIDNAVPPATADPAAPLSPGTPVPGPGSPFGGPGAPEPEVVVDESAAPA